MKLSDTTSILMLQSSGSSGWTGMSRIEENWSIQGLSIGNNNALVSAYKCRLTNYNLLRKNRLI